MRGMTMRWGLAAAATAAALGCGGGGGHHHESPVDTVMTGKAAFGFLEGASVAVYDYDDLTTPIGTSTTSGGASDADVGDFSIPVPQVLSGDVFLVVVTGGSARDANEDGAIDGAPTPNLGTAHAVVRGRELRSGRPVLVSSVSECVYRRTRFLFAGHYPESVVSESASSAATFVLRSSLDADPGVDAGDASSFDPTADRAALFRPYSSYALVVADVLAGLPAVQHAFAASSETLVDFDLPGNSAGAAISGSLAFVGNSSDGVRVYDVDDPTAPLLLSTYDTPGSPIVIQVVGNLAYVSDLGDGLLILDVSDPTALTLVGSVAIPGGAYGMSVRGPRAYVVSADFSSPTMNIVDVSDPTTPTILASVPSISYAASVASDGTFAYLPTNSGVVQVFRVRHPDDLASVGTFSPQSGDPRAVAVEGETLYVATTTGLEVFDLRSDGAHPASLSFVPQSGFFPEDVAVAGGIAYVSRSFDGIDVADVGDPSNARALGMIPVVGPAQSLGVGSGLVLAADSNGGFHVVGAGIPAPAPAVATVRFTNAASVRVLADRAYVASSNPSRFEIYDLSTPAAPVLLGSAALGSIPHDVAVRATHAYVGTDLEGLVVLDVSDPTAPAVVGSEPDAAPVYEIALGTDVAWTAVPGDGLVTIDITDPTAPTKVGALATASTTQAVAYDGANAVFVGDSFAGLRTYDVTTQAAPVFRAALGGGLAPIDVEGRPNRAYVADFSGSGTDTRLVVVDTTTLTAPAVLGSAVVPQSAIRLDLLGDDAFMACRASGVHVVDVTTASAPVYWARLPVEGNAVDVSASATVVGVVGAAGLSVLLPPTRAVP